MTEQQVSLPQSLDDGLVAPQSVLSANWLRDQKCILNARRYKLAQEWGVPMSLMLDEPAPKSGAITQNIKGIGTLGAVAIAAASSVIPTALAAYLAFKQPETKVENTNTTKGFLIDFQPPKTP